MVFQFEIRQIFWGEFNSMFSCWVIKLTPIERCLSPEYPGLEVPLERLHELSGGDEDVALADHHKVTLANVVTVPGEVPLPESLCHTVAGGGHVDLDQLCVGTPVLQLLVVFLQLLLVGDAGLVGHGHHHLGRGQSEPEVGGEEGCCLS